VKIVAILQTYNEQRFVGGCLDHLAEHGISAYLVDNESTDDTVAIAERRLAHNLVGIETLARDGHFALHKQLARKEELAQSLDADWLIHQDADERRVAPDLGCSLAQAIEQMDEAGFNAVNFLEFTFVPTREAPDHDHPDYVETMRSYYPFLPSFPHRLNAWKRQDGPVDLTRSGGHVVSFAGLRMAPRSMYARHYLFLSVAHASRKFGPERYAPDEVAGGWHGWRLHVTPSTLELPSEHDLRVYTADHLLDPSDPNTRHAADVSGQPTATESAQRTSLRHRSGEFLKRAARRTGLHVQPRKGPTGSSP
jgi:glycosyltransferase involved in cell wall biosynthesis